MKGPIHFSPIELIFGDKAVVCWLLNSLSFTILIINLTSGFGS